MGFRGTFQHQEALFAAAVEEFAAAGYEQASINTILKKAGMSKGQFYYHFENKQALYFALIEIIITRKRAFLAEVMDPADFQQDIFGIFETQIRHGLAFAKEYPEIEAFADSFLREKGSPIYEAALARFNFDNDQMLGQLVAAAYAQGLFRPELPLSFVQKTIGYLFTHAVDLTDLSAAANAEENLNHLITFMKSGLARTPNPAEE